MTDASKSRIGHKNTKDSRKLVADLLDLLLPRFTTIGFEKSGADGFRRKRGAVANRFLLQTRRADFPVASTIYVTPIVHTNFAEVLKITRKIRPPRLNGLPCFGGALGGYSPRRSLIEWKLEPGGDVGELGDDLWNAVECWAIPFWETTQSLESAFEAVSEGLLPQPPPFWDDLAAMHFVLHGIDAAVQFVLALPEHKAMELEKIRTISVLNSLSCAK